MFDHHQCIDLHNIENICSVFESYLITPAFGRTKAEPPIYYMPAKPIIDDPTVIEQNKEKVYPTQTENFVIVHTLVL